MADRKISDLTALTTPASGDYLPIVDISEIAASSKNKRITIEELFRGVPLGTAAAPSIAIEGDEDTGVFSPGANQLAVATNGAGRLFVRSGGNVEINPSATEANDRKLLVRGNGNTDGAVLLKSSSTPDGTTRGFLLQSFGASSDAYVWQQENSPLILGTNATERLRITSAGLVGIGTSVPRGNFEISTPISYGGSANQSIYIGASNVGNGVNNDRTLAWKFHVAGDQNGQNLTLYSVDDVGATNGENPRVTFTRTGVGIGDTGPDSTLTIKAATSVTPLRVSGPSSEFARIDTSGRLLVGTSTERGVGESAAARFEVEGTSAASSISVVLNSNNVSSGSLKFGKTRGGTVGSSTIVQNNDSLGALIFAGADGTDLETPAAYIIAQVDGTPGANDMPGRLVFSTTADGAASPTERLRITSAGVLQVADAGNIAVGTTTGTKIGTATTQKLGFYNATPVVQPAAVADATDAATVITQLNDLLAKLRTLGIIAT